MRKSFLLLIIVFALSLGFCDTVTAKEKNQNKEKAASPVAVSFDLNTERLPANYKGTDIVKLYSILAKKTPKEKEEFESTAEYKRRVDIAVTNNPYLNTIYAFKVVSDPQIGSPHLRVEYNSDLQKMTIEINTGDNYGPRHGQTFTIREIDKGSSSFIGSNAFGARRTVKSYTDLSYKIALVNKNDFGVSEYGGELRELTFEAAIPSDKAKKLKPNIGALIIGKPYLNLSEGFNSPTFTASDYSGATFSSPMSWQHDEKGIYVEALAVWVYDIRTGEILLKRQLKGKDSYTDNGNGTITDNVTRLIWQKEDDNTRRNWAAAGTYCGTLTLGGHSDWRLPTKAELITIVATASGSKINTAYFPNAKADCYWSSTTNASNTNGAWIVYFGDGSVKHYDKSSDNYVRCVRGEQ